MTAHCTHAYDLKRPTGAIMVAEEYVNVVKVFEKQAFLMVRSKLRLSRSISYARYR